MFEKVNFMDKMIIINSIITMYDYGCIPIFWKDTLFILLRQNMCTTDDVIVVYAHLMWLVQTRYLISALYNKKVTFCTAHAYNNTFFNSSKHWLCLNFFKRDVAVHGHQYLEAKKRGKLILSFTNCEINL